MNESQFTRELKKILIAKNNNNCYIVKNVGSLGSAIGVPDIFLCVYGMFNGIEVKFLKHLPTNDNSKVRINLTTPQIYHLEQIEKAGGIAYVVLGFSKNLKIKTKYAKGIDNIRKLLNITLYELKKLNDLEVENE